MIDAGRVCVKIAGRDAGRKCVVVSVLDEKFVLIDGETRRRKCNLIHLEPLDQMLDIKKDASHSDVVSAFKSLSIELKETKVKKKTVRPRTLRRSKLAKASVEKPAIKPATKKSAEPIVEAQIVKEEKKAEKPKTPRAVKKAKSVKEK